MADKGTAVRAGVEQSRERLVALVLLLQRAWQHGPLTQEQIVRELTVDQFPSSAKGPRKVRAYDGSDVAVRQKFERDKARIRDLGFEIETVTMPEGSVGYRIDPASAYAPAIAFTPDEERVVRLALALCGVGRRGVFSLFSDGPSADGGREVSPYLTPILRALHLRRALAFDYLSSSNKSRRVEPLVLDVIRGAGYLVARVQDSTEIKGYRLNRITSMPVVLGDVFRVDEETLALARAWRPEFARAPKPLRVVVTTNEAYAELLVRQYPGAELDRHDDGAVDVILDFDGPRGALRFVLEGADRVRLRSPKSLRAELEEWLDGVNRAPVPSIEPGRFEAGGGQDVLGQTLQLLHAVYASEDGLRVSELAARFGLAPAHVRLIMDRLVTMEPLVDTTDGTDTFPAHVIKECDDWDDEDNDDSLYRADFSDLPHGVPEPSPLMWRDLYELNIALREAARVYDEPSVHSAIAKIEAAVAAPVQVESAIEGLIGDVERAVEDHAQIKIEYLSASSGEVSVRAIEPREIRVLNGHAYVRAYCTTREDWRTFRVDRINAILATSPVTATRPPDPVADWLTQVGEEGHHVVVVVEAEQRWLFEPLPGARWLALEDGRHAVAFRVGEPATLDRLMLQAGPGAAVASAELRDAGRDLARRIATTL